MEPRKRFKFHFSPRNLTIGVYWDTWGGNTTVMFYLPMIGFQFNTNPE